MECFGDNVLTRAERVHEGAESDQYVCGAGHHFGIDWRGEPATEPQWPPPAELVAALEA